MKKIIISILLSSFIGLAFSQNHKVLDLSKGGVRIADIVVEKIKANQFVVICDSSLSISQVILNAGQSDTMKVKDTLVPEVLYKEKTTNYTNLQLGNDKKDTLQLFVFENSHNYQIEHNNKTWNIIVRKRKSLQTDIFLKDANLHIGDSCFVILDTIRITLIDSLTLSKWDRQLSLCKNGVQLKDSLCITVDDSCCYYYRTNLSNDSIINTSDTLSIKLPNNRSCVIVFEKNDDPPYNYWWLLLLLLITPAFYVYRKREILVAWLKKNKDSNQNVNNVFSDVTDSNASKVVKRQECLRQLNKLLDELLKILPQKINGFEKKKLFVQKDNIDCILGDLTIIEATNKQSLLNKCDEIRQFVKESQTILVENLSPEQALVSVDSKTSEENDLPNAKSEPDWFVGILYTIESLKFESEESREEGLTHSTVERIKADILSLGERIQEELRITKEKENEEVSRSWQIRYDSLAESYNELKASYNSDVMTAATEARSKAEESLNEAMNELKKRASDAEEKAQKVEDSKKNAIAEAVQKEKDSVAEVIEILKRERQTAIDKAEAVEESKKAAIAAAIKKEQESHEKEVQKLKENKQKAEERAQLAEQSKKKAIDDAVQREKDSRMKEEKKLRECKEKAESELARTTRSLEATLKELKDTKTDRDNRITKILQLEKSQEQFTRSLSSVPFAEIYSKQIHELLKLGSQIQTAAYSILDSNVEDPYFIMKAISKFGKMIDSIDMETFLTDINMVSKAKFVLKDSSLATFKEDNKDIDSIVRSYFFNQYLEKYINAIMVLNESMSGLKLLLPEVQSKVTTFDKYRDELLLLAKKLKVSILYVKVGDMAGENIDLKAKTVDVEIGKPGQILEIENCIVYLMDNRKPQTKIKVTIKK